jgi:GTPase SAR1 family protein
MAAQSASKFDHLIKLIIVGNSCVGKSQLMHRFAQDTADTPSLHPSTGLDFRIRSIQIGDARCKVQIWDTNMSNVPGHRSASFCRGFMGIIFAYSITDEEAVTRMPHWCVTGIAGARSILAFVQVIVEDTVCYSLVFASGGCAFCNFCICYGLMRMKCSRNFVDC